ncbi:hypothetical protein N2599_27120 (plasmid) [Rhizobium sullae]|uniref:Uncharacterized protein n=1 Tax=Rhizobium sullae TaxID=50338 RepID=A0A2N0DBE6_RHISU|nr:hypothetical protein [Rhizobium sullae]PKA43425.1 hypothetical protein CWR43_10660 [Rhizobium sullae]UWU18858.1 hypothetical protein N2599_27120 [Rhizobium sullae]
MRTYYRYKEGEAAAGSIVIKFYRSGDQIRGFIRKVTEPGQHDTVFSSEELQVNKAFLIADNKHREAPDTPIFVELTEGVRWNPAWGQLN